MEKGRRRYCAAAPVAVKAGSEEGTIDIATFEKIVKENPGSIMLIDVRDKDEFDKGSFQNCGQYPGRQPGSEDSGTADRQTHCVCLWHGCPQR